MLTDASETRWQARQHPGQLCAMHPDHPFTVEPKAYLLPRGEPAFQAWVDQWLHSDLSEGAYQRFSQPWTGERPPSPASEQRPTCLPNRAEHRRAQLLQRRGKR
jgi:ABC-type amino acid transport substrate-binding protein